MSNEQSRQKNIPTQFGPARFFKSERLRLRSDFDRAKKNGVKYVGNFICLMVAEAPKDILKLGIICGKKYSRKAVERNRAKRVLREVFRLTKNRIGSCELVMIPRYTIMKAKTQDVQKDFITLIEKAGKWKSD